MSVRAARITLFASMLLAVVSLLLVNLAAIDREARIRTFAMDQCVTAQYEEFRDDLDAMKQYRDDETLEQFAATLAANRKFNDTVFDGIESRCAAQLDSIATNH